MNPVHVRSTTIGVTVVLLGAAGLFGWRAQSTPPVAPVTIDSTTGATLFRTYCSGCHAEHQLAAGVRTAPDRAARLREIEQMLASHGGASPEENRRIVAYLDGLAR